MVEQFRVGVITGTHGLKGEVKVLPTTDDPERFLDLEEVVISGRKDRVETRIRSVRFFKKYVLVCFEGMDRIEDVQHLKGAEILIDREDALPLEEGEYFIPDLIGLKVRTLEGEEIGTLTDVLETGANDVFVVSREGDKDLLLPRIDQCVRKIDLEGGFVEVFLMPGLTDL